MLEEGGKYDFLESTDFYHPALYAPELCRPVCPRPVLGVRGPGPESLHYPHYTRWRLTSPIPCPRWAALRAAPCPRSASAASPRGRVGAAIRRSARPWSLTPRLRIPPPPSKRPWGPLPWRCSCRGCGRGAGRGYVAQQRRSHTFHSSLGIKLFVCCVLLTLNVSLYSS